MKVMRNMAQAEDVAKLLEEAAQTYILPRFQALKDHEISSKSGPRDLVTQADIETEEFLSRTLPDILPGSFVVGEEGISSGKISLDELQAIDGAIWVVDPVDGTYNFVHGKEQFGVMVALIVDGQTRAGWIYNILAKEMVVAEQGGGAFINGEKPAVKPASKIEDMAGFINPRYFHKDDHDHIAQAREQFKQVKSLGCAAHEYIGLIKGEEQFSIYNRQKPWDHLPGALILQEAGGYVAKWDGAEYTPQDWLVGLIAASSEENWGQAHDAFVKGMSRQH